MAGVRLVNVKREDDGLRLDRWFRKHFPALTQGRLEKLLRRGLVRLDGKRVKAAERVAIGQIMRVPPEVPPQGAKKSERPVSVADSVVKRLRDAIIHKDKDVLVLNKPSGLAVQGGSKTTTHIDAALPALQFDEAEPPRLVHRLDRDTSGVLVLARNRKAAQFLTRQFADRATEKIYWALVYGVPRPPRGHIIVPLAKRAAADGGERVRPVEKGDA
jgi:23S rRNA pseudouridine955/2504/2580 synthase